MASPSPKKPDNYSWVEKDVLAAMAYPDVKGNMEYLKKEAIATFINYQNIPKDEQKKYDKDEVELAEEKQYVADPKGYGITVHYLYIKDFTSPSFELMIKMNDIIEKAKTDKLPVGMHCWGGSGRTGTMVASYLIYKRKDTNAAEKDSYVDDIIKETRKIRPHSIELNTQEEVLHTYWFYLQESKKGDALKKTNDLVKLKEHKLKQLQPDVTDEGDYTLENCKKAREYAVKNVK